VLFLIDDKKLVAYCFDSQGYWRICPDHNKRLIAHIYETYTVLIYKATD